jgi:RimJ/RimL family protein N-acetyltransferase
MDTHQPPVQAALEVRRLRPGEGALYRQLRLRSLQLAPDIFGDTWLEQAAIPQLPLERMIDQGSTEGFVVGAFQGPSLVGIAGFVREARRKRRHSGMMVHVYVEVAMRGRQLGRRLVESTVAAAFALPGVELIELGAHGNNTSAIRIYEAAGFRLAGVQRNFFKDDGRYADRCAMQLLRG